MSHSTVLVIGEEPEKMLAPYNENIEVEPYRRYDDTEKPSDHWAFDALTKEEGLSVDADWPAFVAAHNRRYADLLYDEETDRVYTMSTYNPLSRWDWYLLGGRWTGYFLLKAGREGHRGEPGVMTSAAEPGWVDQARKGDIDWEQMAEEATRKAAREHAEAMRVLAGLPMPATWDHVRDDLFPGDIDAARVHYHAQPAIRALHDAKLYYDDPTSTLRLNEPDPAAAYVAAARARSGLPFAILDENGWHERGRMGWFGMVRDESEDWDVTARAVIDAAPAEALFSLYDVHI